MNAPNSAFDECKANALGIKTINGLRDLPPSSDEVIEQFGDRLIWDEMMAAGLLSQKQRDVFVDCNGATLRDYLSTSMEGRVLETPAYLRRKIWLTPKAGDRLALDIGNFIRATYGFEPEYLPIENEKSPFSSSEDLVDVSALDDQLTEVLEQQLDLSNADLSEEAQEILHENNIKTVGDFLVLSKWTLHENKGLTLPMITRIERAIESQTGLSKPELRRNKTAAEAVKWKYAVLKARTFKGTGE